MVGCIATVKSVTETAVQALKACREANYEWYVGIVCEDQTATQHLANLEYTNSCTPDTVYAYTSGDAENDAAATDNSVSVKAKINCIAVALACFQQSIPTLWLRLSEMLWLL